MKAKLKVTETSVASLEQKCHIKTGVWDFYIEMNISYIKGLAKRVHTVLIKASHHQVNLSVFAVYQSFGLRLAHQPWNSGATLTK